MGFIRRMIRRTSAWAFFLLLVTPWAVSLVWMRAAGVETKEAAAEVESVDEGEEKESTRYENGESVGDGIGEDSSDRSGAGTDSFSPSGTGQEESQADRPQRRILMERKGIQTYMDLEDYLPGVIACQIDASLHEEALKCQAVIARTYLYRLMDGRETIHEEELDLDYLEENMVSGFSNQTGTFSGQSSILSGQPSTISDQSSTFSGRAGTFSDPVSSLSNREAAAAGLRRCRQAAEATTGVIMKYDGRYILPLFHPVSAGRTRDGDEDFPYLRSVESMSDQERADYSQVKEWSRREFAEAISQIPGATPVTADQLPREIQTVEKDDAGYMVRVQIGAKVYTGDEVQWALGLASPCFSLEGNGDRIRAWTRGRGHGYGLSQAGADAMAREGWGYEEILPYYYKNISLNFE